MFEAGINIQCRTTMFLVLFRPVALDGLFRILCHIYLSILIVGGTIVRFYVYLMLQYKYRKQYLSQGLIRYSKLNNRLCAFIPYEISRVDHQALFIVLYVANFANKEPQDDVIFVEAFPFKKLLFETQNCQDI